jgi:hypothetical protein
LGGAVVDLAPGAEHDPLAKRFAEIVRRNLGNAWQEREFLRLRGSAAVFADDAGTALTLRFDFGRLTVHEGVVGIPDVTIRGPMHEIEALTRLPFPGLRRVPSVLSDRDSRAAIGDVVRALKGRSLKIYGLLFHARFVVRLLRVLSSAAGTDNPET